MSTIKLEITSCKQCPHFKTMNEYSTDGFDLMIDWVCTKHPENSMRKYDGQKCISNTEPGKLIQGGVEWHEEKHIKVPDWCPIAADSNKKENLFI